jgi:hypothetical protein
MEYSYLAAAPGRFRSACETLLYVESRGRLLTTVPRRHEACRPVKHMVAGELHIK